MKCAEKAGRARLPTLMAGVLLALVLLCPAAKAAGAAPFPGGTGSLVISLQVDGKPVSGAGFSLYQVAALDTGANVGLLRYTLLSPFTPWGGDLSAVNTSEQARQAAAALAGYIAPQTVPTARTVTGTNGQTPLVGSLSGGVYLAVQTAVPSGYTKAEPFLIWLPRSNAQGTGWDYALTVFPKVGRVATPSPTPKPAAATVKKKAGTRVQPCAVQTVCYVPKTDDRAPLELWLGALVVSGAAFMLLAFWRHIEKRRR